MSTSGMAGHSNVSRILCRTRLCPQLLLLPSKASLHDLPWITFADGSVQVLENVLDCHFTIGSEERRVVELLPKAGFQQCEAVGVSWLQQPGQANLHMHYPDLAPYATCEEAGPQVCAASIQQ